VDKSKLGDDSVLVGFELPPAVAADSVSVCGEFNGWSTETHPLTRQEDGSFRAELPLPAGQRWRFRYLLDGQRWENDWAADAYVPNGLGQDDSVVDLTEPAGLPLAALIAAQAASAEPEIVDVPPVVAPDTLSTAEADVDGTVAADAAEPVAEPAAPTRRRGRMARWWRRVTGRGKRPAPAETDGETAGADQRSPELAASSA
jgi:hypothetical protein